jgi:hypothetical protein
MLTEEDLRRLLETRHDLDASAKPELMTADSRMKAALTTSRTQLETARNALQTATGEVSREKSETEAKRVNLQNALGSTIARYGYIRGKVQDGLLNPDPDQKVDAKEIERRYKLFNRVFGTMPSDFDRLAQKAAIETIGPVVKALSEQPDLKPFGYASSLAAEHSNVVEAASALNREVDEDAAAMVVLRGAREELDRKAWAHALQVESVLVREKKEAEIGRYLLARDPAYAARRAARVPVAQEPGAGEISAGQAEGSSTPK